jgi:hypothetical protein
MEATCVPVATLTLASRLDLSAEAGLMLNDALTGKIPTCPIQSTGHKAGTSNAISHRSLNAPIPSYTTLQPYIKCVHSKRYSHGVVELIPWHERRSEQHPPPQTITHTLSRCTKRVAPIAVTQRGCIVPHPKPVPTSVEVTAPGLTSVAVVSPRWT